MSLAAAAHASSSARPNACSKESALRESRRSIAASASALVGLERSMPSASGGMSVSAETSRVSDLSMSACGVMVAWASWVRVGLLPSSSTLMELMAF